MLFVGWFWLFSPSIYITWCLRCVLSNGPWRRLIRVCSLCNVVFPQDKVSVVGRLRCSLWPHLHIFFISIETSSLTQNCLCPLKSEIFIFQAVRYVWHKTDGPAFPAVLTLFLFKGIYDDLPLGYLFIFYSMTTFPVMSLNISSINPSGNKIMH